MGEFAPWDAGEAHRHEDGSTHATLTLKPDAELFIDGVFVSEDQQTLTVRFVPAPQPAERPQLSVVPDPKED